MKKTRTSIYINKKNLGKIDNICRGYRKTRKEVINLLLMKFMKNHRKFFKTFQNVQYQKDDIKENWTCYHIAFDPGFKEKCEDLRKFCKISISNALAMSVDLYLDVIFKDDDVDNYVSSANYLIHYTFEKGIFCTHLYWGLPENKYLKRIISV